MKLESSHPLNSQQKLSSQIQMTLFYYFMHQIRASQSGDFPSLNTTLSLPPQTTLRVTLASRRCFSLLPMLVTNCPQPLRSPKAMSPKKPSPAYKKVIRGETTRSYPFDFHWVYHVIQHRITSDGCYLYDVKCSEIGNYFLRILWVDWDKQIVEAMGNIQYFVVEEPSKLNTLCVQTILPNLVSEWDFEGYNAFHLCPIQVYTRSLYAIKDQLRLARFKDLQELGQFVKNSQRIIFVDIVLNHTSPDSEWLDEEECVYNERTVPQLASALELDLALEKVQAYDEIEGTVSSLRLEEYFLLPEELLKQYEGNFNPEEDDDEDDDNIFTQSPVSKLANELERNLSNLGVSRMGAKVTGLEDLEKKYSKKLIGQVLAELNRRQRARVEGYVREAIANVQNYYKRENRMQRYFFKLNKWYAAYNGWIDQINPDEDFVTSSNFHYLRRTINHWHVIKLRFAEDTPKTYERFKLYIRQMASVFPGIRIDNGHSTPYPLLRSFLKAARKVNPNLLIFAELFGLDREQKLRYQAELGVNAQVSELIWCQSPWDICHQLQNRQISPMHKPPTKLVYDQSHDNECIITKYGPQHLVAVVSALTFADVFRGTNRMVDQFYDRHISCVFETRSYPKQRLGKLLVGERRVRFTIRETEPDALIELRGSFDNWQTSHRLTYNQAGKQYIAYLKLPVGRHEYKYIINGEWKCDPTKAIENDNNVIVISEVECYQQLTFIRSLNLHQHSQTYLAPADNYILITKTNDDHKDALVIFIAFQEINQSIPLVGKVESILCQYSYLDYCETVQQGPDFIPAPLHLVDASTQYCSFEENILHVNAPASYVVILKCLPAPQVQFIEEYLAQVPKDLPLSLLYKPLSDQQYEIPDLGSLKMAGLYGVYGHIQDALSKDHPLYRHLQNGNWLVRFYLSQLPELQQIFQPLLELPQIYLPFYFFKSVTQIVQSIENQNSKFSEKLFRQVELLTKYFSLTDTPKIRYQLMALKGILLTNGRFGEAREYIESLAETIRYGLIPSTLKPLRYNSRDNCFWWIKAIRDYTLYTDDTSLVQSMHDHIMNIFQSHANGINFKENFVNDFTEREGLQVQLQLDAETGFIMGGNYKNCLTWMDTMGSSPINQGYPAASRDGAPIESTALLKICVDFIAKMNQMQKFPSVGININHRTITWKAWSDFICQHFERCYYVPQDPTRFGKYAIIEKHVRRKGIYKDIFKSSKPRSDYQLRSNSCIAIALAPELFNRQHVIHHLALVEQNLMFEKSLGMSTLDPSASEYCGKLCFEDSTNFASSKMFSLNNGSEFLFLLGYYLKALLKIHKLDIQPQVYYSYLAPIRDHLLKEFTLPEYTDSNGELVGYQNSLISAALIREVIDDKFYLDQQSKLQ